MKWEDIKTKLLSRKFWLMLTTFVGLILVVLNINSLSVERIVGIITSFSILVIYILGETMTDIANRKLTAGEKVVVSVAQKLSSRKFWAALISFITTLMVTLGVDALTIEHVEALIIAVATVAIYILGESAIDVSKIRAEIESDLKEVEAERDYIIEDILGQLTPLITRNWIVAYILAQNGQYVNVYGGPNVDEVVATIAHGTQVLMEPNITYGPNGEFYKICSIDGDMAFFILKEELSEGKPTTAGAAITEENKETIGYAQVEASCTEGDE